MSACKKCIYLFILFLVFAFPVISAQENQLSGEGTISFLLHTDKTYCNGNSGDEFVQNLIELPGLGNCFIQSNYYAVNICFLWEKNKIHKGFYLLFTELPGPRTYSFTFTWDAKKGLSDMYLNGILARLEDQRYYSPWEVMGQSKNHEIPPGPNKVTDVKILPKYMTSKEVEKLVPKEIFGNLGYLITGNKDLSSSIDIDKKKGKLLYSTGMNNKTSMKGWVLEGPAEISFKENMMIMRSQIPNPPDGSTGHFNYWCPVDFPENFILEWEFQQLNQHGVNHLFFAAKGVKGEDIFDPSLPKRDGHYQQYHSEAINNYFVIYFSNRRLLRTTNIARSHLYKGIKPRILTYGQLAITPGVKKFHRVCLIKDKGHIQLIVNGKVYLDFTDRDENRWGPILTDGKIGFRQMAASVSAYRNFKVWELKKQ